MFNKLCLGTAQFGFDYGITNVSGKIDDSEVVVYLNRLSDLLWMLAREFENDWTPSK